MENLINEIDGFVWGPYLLIPLLLITGIVLTIRLRAVSITKLFKALRIALFERSEPGTDGDISQFQALATALSATIGVGNIVGVATAISIGGPGAIFWIWITGLFGMASKYAETYLGSRYRIVDDNGEQSGGPGIYLSRAISGKTGKILATLFASFGALACFGIGNMTQGNAIASQLNNAFGIAPWITGGAILLIVGAVLLGGVKRLGQVSAAAAPFKILLYLCGGTIVLICNAPNLGNTFLQIFEGAFTGTSAVGGFAGAGVMLAMRYGMARGIFSNESGMGSSAIIAAAAQTSHPVRQGFVAMTQTFISAFLVVTFTGLVIISSNNWFNVYTPDGSALDPAMFPAAAFSATPMQYIGVLIVVISIVLFALTTILGWSYYGEKCAAQLFGTKITIPYRILFTLISFVGATIPLNLVWNIADILNGLMALPNLIGLLLLSGLIAKETRQYLNQDPNLSRLDVPIPKLRTLKIGKGFVDLDDKWSK